MGVRISGDLEGLERRLRSMRDLSLRPAARKIGEALVSSSIRRFNEQKAPDGTPWQPLAASTIAPRKRDFTRSGRLRKSAERRLVNRKILIQTARLRNSIAFTVNGTTVAVGTNVVYAATHQFGAKAGAFGRTSRGQAIPFGDIPARPFLGISREDQVEIERILKGGLDTL
ncbi:MULTISPECIES: phage virion morphogenesis protein [unclassified Meiothermus]|uniref:phage virion morphogenesis protein n=1 Tax=unclassified Meiothermus TaxID=370471 RepID=UPI000D7CDC5A|nr:MULTISPECIES: phage virion morphogenesis protein [unclassified Meiothermus]PZA07787.1 phage virion morphogenesis protein [Meiothermus sp. Pnk-1]RYM38911.1 phage virion morphogenesis protein [Meiothermus sp. PNK-Is4]